jgi:hypothetical protein
MKKFFTVIWKLFIVQYKIVPVEEEKCKQYDFIIDHFYVYRNKKPIKIKDIHPGNGDTSVKSLVFKEISSKKFLKVAQTIKFPSVIDWKFMGKLHRDLEINYKQIY